MKKTILSAIAAIIALGMGAYGNEELVNTFRDKLLASYPTAAAVYDEAINA